MVPYKSIFCPDEDEDPKVRDARLDKITKYITNKRKGSFLVPNHLRHSWENSEITIRYVQQFKMLVDLMKGKGTKKMVDEAAKSNVYPRKMMHGAVNLSIVYVTGIVYCVARLLVVGVGIPSLRSMPDGIYVTTWIKYIPSI